MKDAPSSVTVGVVILSIILVVVFILRGLNIYFANYNNDEKKGKLNLGTSYICHVGLFGSKSYLVSKSDGWSGYKKYFKKDDILVYINTCQER